MSKSTELLEDLFHCFKETKEATTLLDLYEQAIVDFPGLKLPSFQNFMNINFGEQVKMVNDGERGKAVAFAVEYNYDYLLEYAKEADSQEEDIAELQKENEALKADYTALLAKQNPA